MPSVVRLPSVLLLAPEQEVSLWQRRNWGSYLPWNLLLLLLWGFHSDHPEIPWMQPLSLLSCLFHIFPLALVPLIETLFSALFLMTHLLIMVPRASLELSLFVFFLLYINSDCAVKATAKCQFLQKNCLIKVWHILPPVYSCSIWEILPEHCPSQYCQPPSTGGGGNGHIPFLRPDSR